MADPQDQLLPCPHCGCAATDARAAWNRRIAAQPAPAARESLTFEEWWESAGPNTVSAYESARSTWEFLVAHGVNQPKEGSA